MVDLDGARKGRPVNLSLIERLTREVSADVEVGGGIRTEDSIRALLDAGARRVVLGTQALRDPDWAARMAETFPSSVVLGLDARDGRVAVEGWTETSDVTAVDLVRRLDDAGFVAIIYTNVARDGAMQGPDVAGTRRLAEEAATPVIASGGIATLDDVAALADLPIAGMIVGRALYEDAFTLAEAAAILRAHS